MHSDVWRATLIAYARSNARVRYPAVRALWCGGMWVEDIATATGLTENEIRQALNFER